MKVVAIIQARMGSTRLPGKVMMQLQNQSVLKHVINRVSKVDLINQVVIATTKNEIDDVIVDEAYKAGATVYRGSEDDVLSRYYEAALKWSADIVIRITSDCPLIDHVVLSEILEFYLDNNYDYVSNTLSRTYPRGLDIEVFSFPCLEKVYKSAQHPEYREHVTPYIYGNTEKFKIYDFQSPENFSQYRWTLDTIEDWTLIEIIYNTLYKDKRIFEWMEVVRLMEENPHFLDINAHVEQKKLNTMNGSKE